MSKKVKSNSGPITITGNHFAGVHWDATSVAAIQTVAEGLRATAEGLATLAAVFTSQNISIPSLLTIEQSKQ